MFVCFVCDSLRVVYGCRLFLVFVWFVCDWVCDDVWLVVVDCLCACGLKINMCVCVCCVGLNL